MEGKIVYFDRPGRDNTEETFRIAKERAEELGIKTILVASTRGETAVRAVEVFDGMKVIAVTHQTGFRGANVQDFTEEARRKVESKGGRVLTSTDAFAGGVNRAMRKRFNMSLVTEVVGSTLRIFGQGMKVVGEIVLMAADAGLVRTDEDIVVIAGTGRGADTAVVLKPVNSSDFFDLRIKEILCKPYSPTVTPVPAAAPAATAAPASPTAHAHH